MILNDSKITIVRKRFIIELYDPKYSIRKLLNFAINIRITKDTKDVIPIRIKDYLLNDNNFVNINFILTKSN